MGVPADTAGTVLYAAVRDNLATLLAEASEVGRGLPRYVERDFFSCKGRGVCPSCNAKRAHVTAAHRWSGCCRTCPTGSGHCPFRTGYAGLSGDRNF
ncbi:hypothetical protein ACN28S_01490 [Cystobacter fuscus]